MYFYYGKVPAKCFWVMFKNISKTIPGDSSRIRPNFENFVLSKKVLFGWSTSVINFTIVNIFYFRTKLPYIDGPNLKYKMWLICTIPNIWRFSIHILGINTKSSPQSASIIAFIALGIQSMSFRVASIGRFSQICTKECFHIAIVPFFLRFSSHLSKSCCASS